MALVALGTFVCVLFILYTFRYQALNGLVDLYTTYNNNNSNPSVLTGKAPKSVWDPEQKYLVYLPFAGISNQFYSFQNAATMAKWLNRTLIIPPITSNRHDRLGTNQPWSHYMDIEHMASDSGIKVVEWHNIKAIDSDSRKVIESGSRANVTTEWKTMAEPFPCQVIRNYGRDYLAAKESVGGDFAYQYFLDLIPVPVPGFAATENAAYVQDILDANQNSTDPVICFTFTFTAQFQRNKNRWDVGWEEAGKYLKFLPRFASYVEDLIAYRFGLLDHPHPPLDLGNSILDKDNSAEALLWKKPNFPEYIAIHLRRGDIETKCINQTKSDCTIPLSEYKSHVDAILTGLPKGATPPKVVLVSDTESAEEKATIDNYGWYRLDHAVDPILVDAAKVLGPFSPALIDSAVLTGRGARWVIGSRRSTMSRLAAMRIASWGNLTIIYPQQTAQEAAQVMATGFNASESHPIASRRNNRRRDNIDEDNHVVTWDRYEQHYFDLVGPSYK